MPQVIIPALISAGAATGGMFALTIGTSFVLPFTLSQVFIFTFVSTFIMGGLNMLLSKGSIDGSMGNLGSKFVHRSSDANTQIIFGETRVGGTLVFVETTGATKKILHLVAVFAGEEIEGFTGLRINEIDATIRPNVTGTGGDPFSGGGTAAHDTTYYVTNTEFTNTDNEANLGSGRLCSVQFFNGYTDQDHSSELAGEASEWDSDHDLRGLAYGYFKLVFDTEKWTNGIPTLSVTIKGRRPEDPRKATTLNGAINTSVTSIAVTQAQATNLVWATRGVVKIDDEVIRYEGRSGNTLSACTRGAEGTSAASHSNGAAVTTRQWSSNPALCLRDYLISPSVGLAASASEINDLTTVGGFVAAANECDETVTIEDFPTNGQDLEETRYECHGSFTTDSTPENVIRSVCTSMLGQVFYTAGQFNVTPHQYVTPTITLTEEDCIGPLQISRQAGTGAIYNGSRVTYADASSGYQITDAPIFTSTAMLNEDTPGGTGDAQYRKYYDMDAPYTTSSTAAQRLGILSLKNSRSDLQVQGTFTLKALQLQPSDTVMITNSRLGLSAKVMKVLTMDVIPAGGESGLGITMVMSEDLSSDYTITAAELSQAGVNAPISYDPPNVVNVQADSSENPFTWSKSEGTWTPAAATKDITVYFYRAATTIATHTVRGTLTTGTGNIAAATQGSPTGEATTIAVSGGGTGVCTAKITHTASGFSHTVTFQSSILTDAPANPTVYVTVTAQGATIAQWLRAEDTWEPSEADQTLTAKFYRGNTLLATQTVTGDLNASSGTIDVTVNSATGTEASKITSAIVNDNSVKVDVQLTHTADNADGQTTYHDMVFTSESMVNAPTAYVPVTAQGASVATWLRSENTWEPSEADQTLTAKWYRGSTLLATQTVTGDLNASSGAIDVTVNAASGTEAAKITSAITNDNTTRAEVLLTHTADNADGQTTFHNMLFTSDSTVFLTPMTVSGGVFAEWVKSEGTWSPAGSQALVATFRRGASALATVTSTGAFNTANGVITVSSSTSGDEAGKITITETNDASTDVDLEIKHTADDGQVTIHYMNFRSTLLTNATKGVSTAGTQIHQWFRRSVGVFEPTTTTRDLISAFSREGSGVVANRVLRGTLTTAAGADEGKIAISAISTAGGTTTYAVTNNNTKDVSVTVTYPDASNSTQDLIWQTLEAGAYTSSGDLAFTWISGSSGVWNPANAQGGYSIVLTPTFYESGVVVADLDVTGTLTILGVNEGNVAITNESVSGTGCTIGTVSNNDTVNPSVVVTHTASGLTVTVRFFATATYSGGPGKD